MAIQFSCPYCTASVKVPDSASGKLGACPKCGTKIRIPTIPIPPVGAPHSPLPPVIAAPLVMPMPVAPVMPPGQGFPDLFQEAAVPAAAPSPPPPPVSSDPFDFSNMAAAAAPASAASVSTPSYSTATRRKPSARKGPPLGKGVLIAIGLGVLVLAGVGIWQYIANLPNYTGSVAGERVPSGRPISVSIPWSTIEVPGATQGSVIAYFQRHQTSLTNNLLKIDILAANPGLAIRFETTADSILVSVDPQLVPDVKTLIEANQAAWDEARKRELTLYGHQLCDNLAKAQLTGTRLEGVSAYRDTVALNALVRGLGRHCEAVAHGTKYPCVFEDEAGKLYFVVHKTASVLTVVEKSQEGRVKVLPPDFQIRASIPATATAVPRLEPIEPEAPVEPEKPAAEGDAEMKKDGAAMKPEADGDKMMEPK